MHLIKVRVPYMNSNDDSNIQEVLIVNIHLRPPLNDDGSATLWTAYVTNKYRLSEVQYLMSHFVKSGSVNVISSEENKYDVKMPIIMLGDYNEHDDDPALQHLTKTCCDENNFTIFRDALKEHVDSKRETHRWPLKFLGGYITYWSYKRLDHCVYSVKYLDCTGCKVIDGYEDNASDHQPCLSNFKFK